MQEIPNEFEIKNKYGDNFGADKRRFQLVKIYKNFALYECYKRNKQNEKEHLFYECFSSSYLCSL